MNKSIDGLHAAIMNLPCGKAPFPHRCEEYEERAYRLGHRDARHAAAELVSALLAPPAPAEPRTLSDFIRNATPEEKEALYLGVIDRANARQNAALSAQTAVQGEAQPKEEHDPLMELLGRCKCHRCKPEAPAAQSREQPQPVHSSAGEDPTAVLPGCHCQTCDPVRMEADEAGHMHSPNMRMIVCAICGNKRCPHATDHRNACTNSNDVGQKGSSWEQVKPWPSDTAAGAQKPNKPELDAAPLPDGEKTCGTCRHVDKTTDQHPCHQCHANDEWEPVTPPQSGETEA